MVSATSVSRSGGTGVSIVIARSAQSKTETDGVLSESGSILSPCAETVKKSLRSRGFSRRVTF